MMYQILSLQTGTVIHTTSLHRYKSGFTLTKDSKDFYTSYNDPGIRLVFKSKEDAQWFISHRLHYNPARKDLKKLNRMDWLYWINDLGDFKSTKHAFEIIEVPDVINPIGKPTYTT